MNNKKRYQKIFMDIFGVDEEALSDNFNFKEVRIWDSFTHLTLIGELEAVFDVMFEPEDILHFGGFENGMKILERYGVDFEEEYAGA